MQDYSYIYVSGMVLTNTEITPHSHNTKQLKNAPGHFFLKVYSYKKQNATLFFRILSFCFASVKSAITGFLRRISKVKTVNIEH
jgi:hypothetical protein